MAPTTFVTSDWHFSHANIIKYCNRPFANVDEMNRGLVDLWNSQVGEYDHVYFLGDFSFNKAHNNPANLALFLRRLNGYKHFILGNHDFGITQGLRSLMRSDLESRISSAQVYEEMRYGGRKVCMFHYPISEWNGSHRDAVHFHGHCHGSRKDLPGRLLDVSIDAHPEFRMWTMDEAIAAADANFEANPGTKHHQTGL